MNTNDHQRGAEIQQTPEHAAEAARVSKEHGHESGHEQERHKEEHSSVAHDHDQALTHGKAARIANQNLKP